MGGEERQQAELRRRQARRPASVRLLECANLRAQHGRVVDEPAELGPQAENPVDLQQQGPCGGDIGERELRARELDADLRRQPRDGVREQRTEAIRMRDLTLRALPVSAMQRRACGRCELERAHDRCAEPAGACGGARLACERVGVGVRAACRREQRALAERRDLRVHRADRRGGLHCAGECRVGAVVVAGQMVGHTERDEHRRLPDAAGRDRVVRGRCVVEHLLGSVATPERVQEPPPRVVRRQAPLRRIGPPPGVGRTPAQRVHPRADQAQVGMAVECRQLVQQAQPPLDHDDASFLVRRQREPRHEMRDVVEVARRRRVVDRRLRRPVRLAPVRRSAVQHRHELGLPALELGAEEVAHEAAVAVRAPAAVERHDEETRPLERVEPPGGIRPLEDGVADRGMHPLEHGRPHEEAPDRRRGRRQVLGPQVVGDVAVVAGERPGVAARAERERREIQPGRPALGPSFELRRLRLGEQHAGVTQQRLHLLPGHGEVVGPKLEQAALRAEARERQARLAPCCQRKRRSGGDAFGERRDGLERRVVAEDVRVVDDEQGRPPRPAMLTNRVEREPHARARVALGPLREQRRLPEPGGRDDGDDGRVVRPKAADQRRARHASAEPLRMRKLLEVERSGCAHGDAGGIRHGASTSLPAGVHAAKGARPSRPTVARIPPRRCCYFFVITESVSGPAARTTSCGSTSEALMIVWLSDDTVASTFCATDLS